jgi:hypothetical protein
MDTLVTSATATEANLFGRYFLGTPPSPAVVKLYTSAMAANAGQASASDRKLLAFAHTHPWSIGYIDAAVALLQPGSEFRRRLYVMCSILEATPDYHTYFLPQHRSWWYIPYIIWVGIRAVYKAIVGIVIVKVVA